MGNIELKILMQVRYVFHSLAHTSAARTAATSPSRPPFPSSIEISANELQLQWYDGTDGDHGLDPLLSVRHRWRIECKACRWDIVPEGEHRRQRRHVSVAGYDDCKKGTLARRLAMWQRLAETVPASTLASWVPYKI